MQPPESTYDLMIKDDLESSQALSCLQIETLVYACQGSFSIGDGAGVGKGRTIAGLIFENMGGGKHCLVELQFHGSADVNEKDAIFNYRRKYLPTQQISGMEQTSFLFQQASKL
ncbi:unnamed protein product [Camellia sinensis]